jgi:hypothetical protein
VTVQRTDRNADRLALSAKRLGLILASGVAASVLAGMHSAFAADSGWREHYSARQTASRADKDTKESKTLTVNGPLFAVISIGDQHVSFYGSDGLVAKAPVSTGMRGHPTPTGVFSIVQKQRWHESNIYSGAPMPFMQRITWSGVAMHAGVLPGYPASHGCIRMPGGFAQRIYGSTQIGQRVIVSPRDIAPAPIAHKTLPVPYLQPADASAQASIKPEEPTGTLPQQKPEQAGVLEPVSLTAEPAAKPRNPQEVAQAMKRDANEKMKAASAATRAANLLAMTKTTEVRLATRKLAAAEAAFDRANDKLAAAARKLEKAEGEEAIAKAAEAKTAVGDAQRALSDAQGAKDTKEQEQAAARTAAELAKAAGKRGADALAEANRRLKPLSMFISRKTGRLYVRQDFAPLFDAPVTFSDPERPIGTHVYVGMSALEDGSALKWVSLSMPPEAEPKPASRVGKRSRAANEETPAAAPALPPETASGALDRITIPDETMGRLAELSWVGASLIVSDHGISGETGESTDFIILTRSRAAAP